MNFSRTLPTEINKWWLNCSLSIINQLAYKMNFLITFLAPGLIFYCIRISLWVSIYTLGNHSSLSGISKEQMIAIQTWILIVSLISQSFYTTDIAMDIKFGRITPLLLYPFSFWKIHCARWIGFQVIQSLNVVLTTIVFLNLELIQLPSLSIILATFIIAYCGSFLWFQMQFLYGLIAFWLEETWVLPLITKYFSRLLSGAIIPLVFFPKLLGQLAWLTPFPYLIELPIKLLVFGEVNLLFSGLLVLGVWICTLVIISKIVWKKGILHYTGAGM